MPRPSGPISQAPTIPPPSSIAEKATIPPGRVPWISRMKGTRPAVDPKATVSYVVARDDDGPALWADRDVPHRVREDFAPGTVLQDRYRLIKELGRGGMGVVYLGKDQRLDRSVAVKAILSHGPSASVSATMDSRQKSSFADEARLGASLTHPSIATVFDFGFQQENPFTVFEYIDGETLRELIDRRGRLPLDEVRLIVGPMAQALDFAHARGIVHRDLKPENIRATEQRLFKILDLGLAREFSRQDDWRFAGTPAYAAPEQAAERPSDGRTDQYALAVIVFELLTGRRPFVSDSWLDLLEMHYSTPPPAPRSLEPDIPEPVEQAILKGLEKDPNRRFSTCTELAVALGCQFLTGPAPLARILLETEIPRMGGRWKTVVYPLAIQQPRVHLALAPDALWAIHRSELMRWPLASLHDLRGRGLRGLSFRIRGVAGKDRQWLRFKGRKEARRWRETIASLIPTVGEPGPSEAGPPVDQGPSPEAAIAPDPRVEPVVLVAGRPAARFQLLGMVEARGRGKRRAEEGLAIRAAMMGADAVVDLNAERLPGFIRTERRASGTAVRVVDAEGRLELASRWFDRQIARIGVPMLVLAVLGLLVGVRIDTGTAGASTDLFFSDRAGVDLPKNFAGFMMMLTTVMLVSRWPQLLRPAAFCFLAKAAQNGLDILDRLAGVLILGLAWLGLVPLPDGLDGISDDVGISSSIMTGYQVVGILWSLALLFVYLSVGRRAWRIDGEFRRLAATSLRSAPIPRIRSWVGRLAWCGAIVTATLPLGWQVRNLAGKVAATTGGGRGSNRPSVEAYRARQQARESNSNAWRLATNPDPSRRDPAKAVELADQAASADPDNPDYLNTRGVARYRTGDLIAAIGDLERSLKLRGFNADDGLFLAMAHARLGHIDQAREWYRKSDEWMHDGRSLDSEVKRFREEAAAVLEVAADFAAKARPNSGGAAVASPRPPTAK